MSGSLAASRTPATKFCRAMSTHDTASNGTPARGPKRIRPYQLVVGIGIFMGLFTVVSGVLPQITKWHTEKFPSREVFDGVPGPVQVAFYTIVPVMLVVGAFLFAD